MTVWHRLRAPHSDSGTGIPDDVRERVVEIALERAELSPRELACRITDEEGYFISGSSVYRILKAY